LRLHLDTEIVESAHVDDLASQRRTAALAVLFESGRQSLDGSVRAVGEVGNRELSATLVAAAAITIKGEAWDCRRLERIPCRIQVSAGRQLLALRRGEVERPVQRVETI